MYSRRNFCKNLLGLTLLATSKDARRAVAMGAKGYPQGIREVQGEVQINGAPAAVGAQIVSGDLVATGKDGRVVIVVGSSVYLLRANTRLRWDSADTKAHQSRLSDVIKIFSGRLLSVMGRGRHTFDTPTAVAGIRGSGVYIEAEPARAYVCVCYGVADLKSKAIGEPAETVRTRHHESPRYVYADQRMAPIIAAPVVNHTDAELILLESLVGRVPPFVTEEGVDDRY